MGNALTKTSFNFPGQKSHYKGKVRDVYNINDDFLVMVVSDRISAFDVVLPKGIPFKGQVLNQIAEKFLDATADIVPNWKIATPDPNVTVGHFCETFPVEMIVRGYLTGSSWRLYKNGGRDICGVPLPEGLKEHQAFPEPLLTPTTKAEQGAHDENISREEIIKQGLVSEEDYKELERISLALFKRGSEIAKEMGLILVDTKYEFGKKDGQIYLIDEIHTPDSSRYFYADGYQERFDKGENQKQLSKEFVREWLMENNFQGRDGDVLPEIPESFVNEVSERYIELYENITGDKFIKSDTSKIEDRIETAVTDFLMQHV
ncbi:phosphoribosylaminoimidazolesuccinocarboxamide synthase [uncultured Draconibacterium sp.]|uniref:phosphoribosylaminoimidazolesuccinocarboxamide synthase n=1 Tax=uncultured Draconibacterium sp. TaxID=1573823 RepID=UPI0029C6B299|nr:phosphoribosylaminoimidazolesuccinocarboxamide synthase [uncultured Draconibacterium sp.]